MKRNIRMEIKEMDMDEGELISGFEIGEEEYKISKLNEIRQIVKKIHWYEFMRMNFQEKMISIIFFILIMFLISILILRFYFKKLK